MLQSLWIKDYILIDELSLDFQQGFSVFTGETGAGKSIIIDAIAILTGARVSESVIREGCSRAIIEGTFEFTQTAIINKLQEAGFDDDVFIVTREVNRNGKSSIKLNHRSVTLSFLKDIFINDIDIHNQKENHYLLNAKSHLKLLDNYAQNQDLLAQFTSVYQTYAHLKKEYDNLVHSRFNEDEIDYIRFQLQEINQVSPLENEDELIEAKIKKYQSFEKTYQTLEQVLHHFNDDGALLEHLANVKNYLERIEDDSQLESIAQSISSHYYELDDLHRQLHDYFSQLEFDEDDFNQLQQRQFEINKLKRKYGHSIEAIYQQKAAFELQLRNYEDRHILLEEKEADLNQAFEKALSVAKKLSNQRKEKAKLLEQDILKQLHALELPNATFLVVFKESELSASGIDQVFFHISTNLGQPPALLSNVASGGEISRIMLGLKAIFSRLQGIGTVIFDEIDTGVSGSVANAIGHKMRQIAADSQVFAITHLPQVASCAQHHYFVFKHNENGQTTTKVKKLEYSDIIKELAHMATGTTSDTALKSAEELMKKNQMIFYE